MKWFIAVFLVLSPFTDLDKIAKVNKAKKEAKEAYLANNFQLASDKYKFLIDSLGVNEEEVLLDYAHTLYNLNDTANAVNNYQKLSESANKNLASIAEQQLGQVLFDKNEYEPALEHYKNALRKNPANQDARYNYELLKKILKKQEEEQKDQQDQQDQEQDNKDQKEQDKDNKDQDKQQEQKDQEQKDQEKQDKEQQDKEQQDKEQQDKKQQDKEQQKKEEQDKEEQKDQEKKDGEKDEDKDEDKDKKEEQKDQEQKDGEKSEEKEKPKPTPSDKLKEMNISEEKAQMILEAMKNKEIQYIQQNRRKATKKKDRDKPDW